MNPKDVCIVRFKTISNQKGILRSERCSSATGTRGLTSTLLRRGGHRAGAKAAPWYSGIGARRALNWRKGRDATRMADGDAPFSDELVEMSEKCSHLLKGHFFGTMCRPFNICMVEYCLCEYSGFLSRSKIIRPEHRGMPVSDTRGGGGAISASGHARDMQDVLPKRPRL